MFQAKQTTTDLTSRRLGLLHRVSGIAVLLVSLLLAILASSAAYWAIRQDDEARFTAMALQIQQEIQARFERYETALVDTRAFFLATPHFVSRQEFHQFLTSTKITERYPGIQGVGFTIKLASHELPNVIAKARREGFPDFKVWPEFPRQEHHAILYLEPVNWRNRRALGYDMFTEATRHEAMSQARDSGGIVYSGIVTLVQETQQQAQPGFLAYAPLYRRGAAVETVEQRRQALEGFVYAPFRVYDLFNSVVTENPELFERVQFQILEGSPGPGAQVIFQSTGAQADQESFEKPFRSLRKTLPIQLGDTGRVLSLEVTPGKNFKLRSNAISLAAIILGTTILSLVLFWIIHSTRQQAELERRLLAKSQSDLEQLTKEREIRERFVATLSHDLRNPLTAAKTNAQLLLRLPGDRAEPQHRIIDRITANLDRADKMIQDLLDVTRLRAGQRIFLQIEYFDLAELVTDTLAELAVSQGERFIFEAETPVSGYWSPSGLRRVLENLALNAIKYGNPEAPITVFLRSDEQEVHLSVHNLGNEISKESQKTLFEPFQRGPDALNKGTKGWGLGLALVKGIAEAHGGQVEVESGKGKGTTFTLHLPRDARRFQSDQ